MYNDLQVMSTSRLASPTPLVWTTNPAGCPTGINLNPSPLADTFDPSMIEQKNGLPAKHEATRGLIFS